MHEALPCIILGVTILYFLSLYLFPSLGPHLKPASAENAAINKTKIDMAIVALLIPRMACRWENIGLQLRQEVLVRNLKIVLTYNAESFCTDVIVAAKEAGCLKTYGKLLHILETRSVGLPEVASDLRQIVVEVIRGQRPATASQELTASENWVSADTG